MAAAQIFISYSSKDLARTMAVCDAVEARGFRCWVAARDVDGGENYQESIVHAIRQLPVMLLVFTANANASPEIKKEVSLASKYNLTLIPLRLEDVLPSDAFELELSTRQWINLFGDWDGGIDRLCEKLARVLSGTDNAAATRVATTAHASPAAAPFNLLRAFLYPDAAMIRRTGAVLTGLSGILLLILGDFLLVSVTPSFVLTILFVAVAFGAGIGMQRGLRVVRWPGIVACAVNFLSGAFFLAVSDWRQCSVIPGSVGLMLKTDFLLAVVGSILFPRAALVLSRWRDRAASAPMS